MSSVIFILDIIFSILSNIIGFFETNRRSAIAIIVLFSVVGFLVLLTVSFLVFCYSEHTCKESGAWIFQILLAIVYYYGKNINGIMIRYGAFLGCGETCQKTNQYIALTSLMLAILFLTYIIPKVHDIIQKKSKKVNSQPRYGHFIFGVIAVYVNANAIFATLSLIPADIQCTLYAVILTSLCLGIITVVAVIKIVSDCLSIEDDDYDYDPDSTCCPSCYDCAILFGYFSLFALVPFYLLGNNQLPLEYISCNFTEGVVTDNGRSSDHIARLILMITTGVVVLCVWCILWKNKKKTLLIN